MKYHDQTTLCLTFEELVPVIIPKGTYDSLKARKQIKVIGRAAYCTQVLIAFETLPSKYKDQVKKQYGNPYQYIAKQPLLDYVKINWDREAEQFYNNLILPATPDPRRGKTILDPLLKRLPENYVTKYTTAATWLNAIQQFTTDKIALKRNLNISIASFWTMCSELIKSEKAGLPTNERCIKDKLNQYKKNGYQSLVEAWRFGNDHSKKVKDQVAEALLIKMLAHPAKHDDTIIAAEYNKWVEKTNQESRAKSQESEEAIIRNTITPGAVKYWRMQKAHLITLGREGAGANYNKYSKRILRDRPSAPLLLVNSDDNLLDLFFKQEAANSKGKIVKNDFYRPALYVVMDTFNDYILGYAIGSTVTIELIKEAYRNAMEHVGELTGKLEAEEEYYIRHQVQTDHWAIDPKMEGPLATFFKNQAIFTPAAVKIAQSKYIERAFGTTWHQQLKYFPNYSGHNITAKEKTNPDAIQQARKNFPDKQYAPGIVAEFIKRMRHTINPKSGLPRQEEWLNAFQSNQKSKETLISAEKRLQLFGIAHPYTNKITASGLRVQINNLLHYYEVPDALYLQNVNKTVQITYDPYDMGRVLVTDGKGLRFIAREYEKMPSAIADYKPGTGKKLHAALEFKKTVPAYINKVMDEYTETLNRAKIDMNSILQAGVLVKETNHEAQRGLSGSTVGSRSSSSGSCSQEVGKSESPESPEEEEIEEEFDWRNAI